MYKFKNDTNDYTFCEHLIKLKYKTILIYISIAYFSYIRKII